jgi:phage replication-related protein YjqB (UPF0714/DUF867 family)
MATYSAVIRKAFEEQCTVMGNAEHCSADPERLATISRGFGHQIRVKRNNSEYALYTVSEVRQESPDRLVRMAQAARDRLRAPDGFDATVDGRVPHPTLTEVQAERHSEFVERLEDDGTSTALIVIAPHGGAIEGLTDRQAERVQCQLRPRGVSSWRCMGWKRDGGAFERWHITSIDIHEASFPLLQQIINRGFAHAVAFHGFDDPEPDILIGGTADDPLKQEIKTEIEEALDGSELRVRIAKPEELFGGDDERNIVNRLCGQNGVQIEQSLKARQDYWHLIADAVASVYKSRV